ncbi:factor-independent urate hydroxylase [Pseudonocardia pini]|uniref:factor-independent urate hydroxylase n=1 Tax=Pseudonocardia pini TaxID=2758030 RepID=UPI0015F04FB5|nr:urate oxidase [Pseudonocardia pini]
MGTTGRIRLGANDYGKAENRVVRIYRDTPRHEIRDVTVSTALRGDFSAAHLAGDQSRVLPTDTQKNTVYAYAKEHGLREIEDYALTLARHFVSDVEPVEGARIEVDEHTWERIDDHAWVRRESEVRTTVVEVSGAGETVRSGLKDLVLLKSTGSEFAGFLRDGYTTLQETHDRIMSTSLVATWTYAATDVDWDKTWTDVRAILLERFASVHSLALQQTLWEMGKAVLETHPEIEEISLSAPNKHHFVVDLTPFGLENPNEVFHAATAPYGLIQATVVRD